MKKLLYSLTLILFAGLSNIMAQDLPKDGAIIVLENPVINLNTELESKTAVKLIRSKRYQNADFGGIMSTSIEGLNISFTEDADAKDTYTMTVSTNKNVETKSYTVIIRGEGTNAHKIRGTTLTINVSANQVVTTN